MTQEEANNLLRGIARSAAYIFVFVYCLVHYTSTLAAFAAISALYILEPYGLRQR